MNKRRFSARLRTASFEALESRRMLSATLPTSVALADSGGSTSAISTNNAYLTGTTINAIAGQSFKAVIGTIHNVPVLPTGYTYQATINWGDGTPDTQAKLVRESDGTIAVEGAHTYADPGKDKIKVTVLAEPPAGTLPPIVIVNQFKSQAKVAAPDGGVTLNETAGVEFTAALGLFQTNLSADSLVATINWGDGTTSIGRILPVPVADAGGIPVGGFEVYGMHKYDCTGSYVVHVTVTWTPPPVATSSVPVSSNPIILVVAQWDSVLDVLPAPLTVVPV